MPRRPGHIPALKLHKPSGLARVIIQGRHHYLGRYGSRESQEKYARLIVQLASGRDDTAPEACLNGLTVSELILEYLQYAQGVYVKDERPTKEFVCMKEALRPLRRLYGTTEVADFSPKKLKVLREHMIQQGWCRRVINQRISRVKRIFRWGTEDERIPGSIYGALRTVKILPRGRTTARETAPEEPVPDDHVRAVLPFVAPQIATMIQLQRMAGMRPGEVVIMRGRDIDMSGETWIYVNIRRIACPRRPGARNPPDVYTAASWAAPCAPPNEVHYWRRSGSTHCRPRTKLTSMSISPFSARRSHAGTAGRPSWRPVRPRDRDCSRATGVVLRKARHRVRRSVAPDMWPVG